METIWFANTLVQVRSGFADGNDGISVFEHHAPAGASAPAHSSH